MPNVTNGDRSDLPKWIQISLKRLTMVASLPNQWAGPLSRSIDHQSISRAFRIIAEVVPDVARYVPQIVPTVDGGLQLEWHQDGFDLEIEIAPTGESYVDYSNAAGMKWEGEYIDLTREVARVLQEALDRS